MPRETRPPIDRLMEKVVIVDDLGCWEFTGCTGGDGYGWLRIGARAHAAHRVTYEHFVGPIPDGLTLDHLCRNRLCVNPHHLEPVTRGENVMRGVGFAPVNKAKTHCPHGHEYSPENTYRNRRGWRACRACHLARMRRRALAA